VNVRPLHLMIGLFILQEGSWCGGGGSGGTGTPVPATVNGNWVGVWNFGESQRNRCWVDIRAGLKETSHLKTFTGTFRITSVYCTDSVGYPHSLPNATFGDSSGTVYGVYSKQRVDSIYFDFGNPSRHQMGVVAYDRDYGQYRIDGDAVWQVPSPPGGPPPGEWSGTWYLRNDYAP
jgi:hypothetical protein